VVQSKELKNDLGRCQASGSVFCANDDKPRRRTNDGGQEAFLHRSEGVFGQETEFCAAKPSFWARRGYNFVHIGQRDPAVPHCIRIDDQVRAVFSLIETPD
jgi:hypothetical protein